MVSQPTLVLLHGGPGADHSPEITGALAASIVCPTPILAGEDDPVSPAAGARRLAVSLTSAAVQVQVLAGVGHRVGHRVGHGVFRQAPHEAFALLRAFLREVAGFDRPRVRPA